MKNHNRILKTNFAEPRVKACKSVSSIMIGRPQLRCGSASNIFFGVSPQFVTGWSRKQTEIRLLIFMGGETTGARSSILTFLSFDLLQFTIYN